MKSKDAAIDSWFKASTNATVGSFMGFMSIEDPDGTYMSKFNQMEVTRVYMFCCRYPVDSFDNIYDTFPDGIILENYVDEEQYNRIIERIKANIPSGLVSNPFVDVDKVRSLPRLIFNKRNG
jgi:hypothetical protein